MSDWPGLDRFLAADPYDVGCEQAREMLHVYVEMVRYAELESPRTNHGQMIKKASPGTPVTGLSPALTSWALLGLNQWPLPCQGVG
jgi:hypothetical protein